jgi:hypothetical protein
MNTAVISALAAGNLAATNEMARLVGEPARFKLLLHEGRQRSVFLSDVGEEMVLITVVNNQTPIGLVRLSTQAAVNQLIEVVKLAEKNNNSRHNPFLNPGTGKSLGDEVSASLDELF